MRQILFYVPFTGIPVFGYGFMLFLAFICCTWLVGRLGRREGAMGVHWQDFAIYLFVSGILALCATFVVQYWAGFQDDLPKVFAFWDGGLVFYGAIPGAIIGYSVFWWRVLRSKGVSHWKMADVVAPCVAVGLCLGRVGCLLNGCCYGNVACSECPAASFPLPSTPRYDMVARGHQTPAGFVADRGARVVAVEAGSAAAAAGLQPGDTIVAAGPPNDVKPIRDYSSLAGALNYGWPRGENTLELVVSADGAERTLPPFVPRGIGLHPTQLYESISAVLLCFFLLSFYPYKTHDGAVMVLFMAGYGVHRLLNEELRIDNEIVALGMTLSQNISIVVLIAAAVLAVFVWRRPSIAQAEAAAAQARSLAATASTDVPASADTGATM